MLKLDETTPGSSGFKPVTPDDAFLWHRDNLSCAEIAFDFMHHKKSLPYSLCFAGYWHYRNEKPTELLTYFDEQTQNHHELQQFPDFTATMSAIEIAEKTNLIKRLNSHSSERAHCLGIYQTALDTENPILMYWAAARLQTFDYLDRASHLLIKIVRSQPDHLPNLTKCCITNLILLGMENNYAKTAIAQLILNDGITHREHAELINRFLNVYCLTETNINTARKLLLSACVNTRYPDINGVIELTRLYFRHDFFFPEQSDKSVNENLLLITKLLYQQYVAPGQGDEAWRHREQTRQQLANWLMKILEHYPDASIVNYHVALLHFKDRQLDLAYEHMSKALDLFIPPRITWEMAMTLMSSAKTMAEQERLEPKFAQLLKKTLHHGGTYAGIKLAEHYGNREFYEKLRALSRTLKIAYITGESNDFMTAKNLLQHNMHHASLTIDPVMRLKEICALFDVKLSIKADEAVRHIRYEKVRNKGDRNLKLFNCFAQDGSLETLKNIESALLAQQSMDDVSTIWDENQFDLQYAPPQEETSKHDGSRTNRTFDCLNALMFDDFDAIEIFRSKPFFFGSRSDEFDALTNRNNLLALALSLKKHPTYKTAEYKRRLAQGIQANRLMHYFALTNKRDHAGHNVFPEVRYLFEALFAADVLDQMPECSYRSNLQVAVKTYYYLILTPENYMSKLTRLKRDHPRTVSFCTCALEELFILTDSQADSLHQADRNARKASPSASRHKKVTQTQSRSLEESKGFLLTQTSKSQVPSPRDRLVLKPTSRAGSRAGSRANSPRLNRTESAPADLNTLKQLPPKSAPIPMPQTNAHHERKHDDSGDNEPFSTSFSPGGNGFWGKE